MVSEFRKKKLMFVFKIFFDVDGCGAMTKRDVELGVERLAKARGWSPGDEQYAKVERALFDIWKAMLSKADSDSDGKMSKAEWIALWDDFAKNPSESMDWQTQYCKTIFDIQDSSGDGAIDKDEFVSVHESFGLPKDQTSEAFKKLSGGEETVSWEQFQKRWEEFFISEDVDAPGNYIFGHIGF